LVGSGLIGTGVAGILQHNRGPCQNRSGLMRLGGVSYVASRDAGWVKQRHCLHATCNRSSGRARGARGLHHTGADRLKDYCRSRTTPGIANSRRDRTTRRRSAQRKARVGLLSTIRLSSMWFASGIPRHRPLNTGAGNRQGGSPPHLLSGHRADGEHTWRMLT